MISDYREIKEKLEKLRNYLRENSVKLGWEEEGRLLEEVDKLKTELRYSRKRKRGSYHGYSEHVLEMKIKYPGPPSR